MARDAELLLPATLLSRYLFFLVRRPVSAANAHYRSLRVAALQSLGRFFDDADVATTLRALTPSNLFRLAPQIQSVLQPRLSARLPRDIVTTPRPPAAELWRSAQRVAVVFGPAIGVGDEIVCSSIPRALRSLAPSVEVLSAYEGLWERIAPEQPVAHYRDLATLVELLRGAAFDAVFYVDFEPAGLMTAVAREARLPRFAELSLGTRQLAVLDNTRRRLHQMPPVPAYHDNFYRTVEQMLAWLGTAIAREPLRERAHGERLIVASPFTSKEDPSESFWRGVLGAAVPRAMRLVLDTGPNAATRAFAIAIRDALRASGTRCDLAAAGRASSLGEMLELVRDAEAVVTADSYLAHAGPLFGATTFVIARPGLEAWRVPSSNSYYFRAGEDPAAAGAAMQALLEHAQGAMRSSVEAQELRERAVAVDFNAPVEELLEAWQRCLDAHNALVAGVEDWPEVYAPLLRDERYGRLMPRPPEREGIDEGSVREHLSGRFGECANTNLWKLARGTV